MIIFSVILSPCVLCAQTLQCSTSTSLSLSPILKATDEAPKIKVAWFAEPSEWEKSKIRFQKSLQDFVNRVVSNVHLPTEDVLLVLDGAPTEINSIPMRAIYISATKENEARNRSNTIAVAYREDFLNEESREIFSSLLEFIIPRMYREEFQTEAFRKSQQLLNSSWAIEWKTRPDILKDLKEAGGITIQEGITLDKTKIRTFNDVELTQLSTDSLSLFAAAVKLMPEKARAILSSGSGVEVGLSQKIVSITDLKNWTEGPPVGGITTINSADKLFSRVVLSVEDRQRSLTDVFVHELGHVIQHRLPPETLESFRKISKKWEPGPDHRRSLIDQFVNNYSMSSIGEDFAEHFRFYILDRDRLEKVAPDKKKFFDQLFN